MQDYSNFSFIIYKNILKGVWGRQICEFVVTGFCATKVPFLRIKNNFKCIRDDLVIGSSVRYSWRVFIDSMGYREKFQLIEKFTFFLSIVSRNTIVHICIFSVLFFTMSHFKSRILA